MSNWSEVRDGTAIGPTIPVYAGGSITTLTALWSDTEGIGVTIMLSPDAVFFKQDMGSLRTAVDQLMRLDPPDMAELTTGQADPSSDGHH